VLGGVVGGGGGGGGVYVWFDRLIPSSRLRN